LFHCQVFTNTHEVLKLSLKQFQPVATAFARTQQKQGSTMKNMNDNEMMLSNAVVGPRPIAEVGPRP